MKNINGCQTWVMEKGHRDGIKKHGITELHRVTFCKKWLVEQTFLFKYKLLFNFITCVVLHLFIQINLMKLIVKSKKTTRGESDNEKYVSFKNKVFLVLIVQNP